MKKILFVMLVIMVFSISFCAEELQVLVANPQGDLYHIEDFKSIQILFSQQMVFLWKDNAYNENLPDFITIEPPIETRYYWSNERLLKIEPKNPFAINKPTKFKVTVKKGTESVEGGVLSSDYVFSFSTPLQKIINYYGLRKNNQLKSPYYILLIFNYEVDRNEIAKCLRISFMTTISDPFFPEVEKIVNEREPEAKEKYSQKVNSFRKFFKKETNFHLVDLSNKNVMKYFNESPYGYLFRHYSEKRIVVLETDEVAPINSLIKVEEMKDSNCSSQLELKELVINLDSIDFALFFKGLSEYGYLKNSFKADEDISLSFTKKVSYEECIKNLKIFNLSDGKEILPQKTSDFGTEGGFDISLKSFEFQFTGENKYLIRIDEKLKSVDGETLGYPAYAIATVTCSYAYVSFGEGEGVWESARGTTVPFYVNNVKTVKEKIFAINKEEIIPTLKNRFSYYEYEDGEEEEKPKEKLEEGEVVEIKGLKRDKVFNAGLDLKPYLNEEGKGIVFAKVDIDKNLDCAPPSNYDYYWRAKESIIQVTDLGLTLKYSLSDFLVYVTSLSKGEPVPDCEIEIRDFKNRVIFSGVTDQNGILKVDKKMVSSGSNDYSSYYNREFVVFAKKGKDLAYIVNNWCEGLEPWNFDIPYTWNISQTPQVAGIVFTDRGVYKLQEEVYFKAILRKKVGSETVLFPEGSRAEVKLYDSKGKVKDKKEYVLSSLSSIDGVFTIEKDYPLGNYKIEVLIGNDKITGWFLVAAYRKPDFRVNVDLKQKEDKIEAKVTSSYLFGAPLSEGKVKYFYEEEVSYSLPEAMREKYKYSEWEFFPSYYERENYESLNKRIENEETLDKNGELKLNFDKKKINLTKVVSFEAEVEDITKQAIANRTSLFIYPNYFVGIYSGEWGFKSYQDGLKTKIVFLDNEGKPFKGQKVKVALKKVVYRSAQYSTGHYYYDWESTRDYEIVSTKEVTTEEEPVEINFEIPSGGEYIVTASADIDGINYKAGEEWWFYGEGYTPWQRYPSNKIDLKVEKEVYEVGETAKILVLSPWEKAKMVVTKERKTIMDYRVMDLTSTQQVIEVPITEKDIPNIFVSVVLIKGRGSEEEQDKPQIRIGYAKISVEHQKKKLNVTIESDKEEYKPAENCKIKVNVKDFYKNNVAGAEVTLWAVDIGVLSLTNYKTPDVFNRLYSEESLAVFNADSREKLISARVSSPKGEDEGGGGGIEAEIFDQIRKDFRVLAFWVGSALTDSEGNFEGEFHLPESLTAFRIMAVVHTKNNYYGSSEKEFIVSKSLMVNPYFPRFLVVNDTAMAKVLLNSRIDKEGICKVVMESLTPEILSIENGFAEGNVLAKGKKEFQFKVKALKSGKAKVRVSTTGFDKKDAFEIEIPVIVPHNGNVRVESGSFVGKTVVEGEIPDDILREVGEFKIQLSTNILTQFTESYEFVINYPYGCAEQRSSILTTLLNNYKFAKAIEKLEEDKEEKARKVLIKGIKSLEPFQNYDGGFGIWVDDDVSYPYLTAYIGKLLVDAKKEGLLEDDEILANTIKYLKEIDKKLQLNQIERPNEEQALALAAKVLAEYNENPDTILTKLSSNLGALESLTLLHLWDAATLAGKKNLSSKIETVIRGRFIIYGNEGHIKEKDENKYYYFWYHPDITTAAGLKSFVTNSKDRYVTEKLLLYLINQEKNINYYWYNPHRNTYVYEALTSYVLKYLSEQKDSTVTVKVDGKKIAEFNLNKNNHYEGVKTIPVEEFLKYANEDFKIELQSSNDSQISYSLKFKWYPEKILQEKEVRGFEIERKYYDLVTKEEKKTFKTGDLIEVRLEIKLNNNQANVVVVDPLPAGFEVLDSAFQTTAKNLKTIDSEYNNRRRYYYHYNYGRFNHIEKYDDKVLLFANYLYSGTAKFGYIVKATSEGEFRLQGASVSCMYNEEVRGSSAGSIIKVEKE